MIKKQSEWNKRNEAYKERRRKSQRLSFLRRYKENPKLFLDRCKKWSKNNPDKVLHSITKRLEYNGEMFNMTGIEYGMSLKVWSESIRKRDNYICQNCGSKENLNAHHIIHRSFYPLLTFILNNGITLCEKCHLQAHGKTL